MYQEIKDSVYKVLHRSQGLVNREVIDSLIDQWANKKHKFIELFGGPIYEWPQPIEIILSESEQIKKITEFADLVDSSLGLSELSDFIMKNIGTFFDNKVSYSSNGVVPIGMKLVKSFKYFVDDKIVLSYIQNVASMIIQENKLSGKLYFSVHPLDFLSSSENNHNWTSCHSLSGDYRSGNLSYMLDESTFMVYLAGENNEILTAFGEEVPWNSKKWRVLFHESKSGSIIFAGRQYPLTSETGLKTVLNIYNNILLSNGLPRYSTWKCNYVDKYKDRIQDVEHPILGKYIILYDNIRQLKSIVKSVPGSLNYNDILKSNFYLYPYYASKYIDLYRLKEDDLIYIGAPVPCLECGKNDITSSEFMRCNDCEVEFGIDEDQFEYCCNCGARMIRDTGISVEHGNEYVCEYCYNHYCSVCEQCGELFYTDNCVYDNGWLCKQCAEDEGVI